MMHCSICSVDLSKDICEPYRIGEIRGNMCVLCAASMESAIAVWIARRMDEVERDKARALREAREAEERVACAVLAKEIAHTRLAELAAEQLPITTRSEIAREKKRSAA